jgi:hypothetical protein
MDLKTVLFLGAILASATGSHAAFGLAPDGHLDKKTLRKAYEESDFDKVLSVLEGFQKKHPADASLEERIFTHKYLGVIYAADSATSIRAESHFNMLLELSPHIELVDMYVSPKIQRLFDQVKSQFEKKKRYDSQYDDLGIPLKGKAGDGLTSNPAAASDSTAAKPVLKPHGSRKWIWWGVGAAAVGIGVGFYLWIENSGSSGSVTKV